MSITPGQQPTPLPQYARLAAPSTVLLVHGDANVRDQLARQCRRDGMTVIEAASGADALRTLFDARPSIVVLDGDSPGLTGLAALERMRDLCDVPVLMLHRKYEEPAVVQALRAGADDVLAGSFGLAEVVARIAALMRRQEWRDPQPLQSYTDGLVEIDLRKAEVLAGGRQLRLTPLEMRLLWEFVTHPRQTLSAEHLLQRVWGEDIGARDRLKIYIGYLRAKFREVGAEAPIVTTRGFGYRYEPPEG